MKNTVLSIPESPEEQTQKIYLDRIHPKVLKAAYAYCAAVTKNHYENFPVASLLLPRHLRPAIQTVYAFSRLADDFADEREYHGARLARLVEWENMLNDTTRPTHPVFIALHHTVEKHQLPKELFSHLLTAFKMDTQKNRYQNSDELRTYCRYSANPVGRLVLALFKKGSEENLADSDFVCTALQLANHWQDVAVDLKKNRVYLPQEDMDRFGVQESDLFKHTCNDSFRMLMSFEVDRTRELFLKGKVLGLNLPGLLGLEIRITWLAGITLLKKIRRVNYDVFRGRPALTKYDFLRLFLVAASKKRYEKFKI